MSRRSIFIISHEFSAFYIFLEKKPEVLIINLKYLSSPSNLFILILIFARDLKLSRKCENVFVFPIRVHILHDTFW